MMHDDESAELTAKLAAVLTSAIGTDTAVENLRALTGGASRTTWAFEAVTGAQRRSLILRTGPPDDACRHGTRGLVPGRRRGRRSSGPHVLIADDSPAALGNPFLICDEIKGETIVRRIQRRLDSGDGHAGRARLLQQCAQAAAAIHRADPHGPGLAHEDQLDEWRRRLDDMGDTTATFEWGFRWLAANRPDPTPAVLVHGDFRMGNLIVDGSDLAAVLDWELVHVGQAYEDLAWFCIRPGDSAPRPAWAPAVSAASRASCGPTSRPARLPSTGWRFTGGWCWPRCAGVSSADSRRNGI